MKTNNWFEIIDAQSPKTSDKARTAWCKTLEGTSYKNGVISIQNNKKKK